MTMTDPIADMLTRLRNANTAMHDDVNMPSSKQKEALAALLLKEGYIGGFSVDDNPGAPDKVAEHPAQVLARARAGHLGHPAGVQAGPAGVLASTPRCPACSVASASPSCPRRRDS